MYDPWSNICVDIRNWIGNIEQHASDNVNKILVGNKADMDESKRVMNENLSGNIFWEYFFPGIIYLLL